MDSKIKEDPQPAREQVSARTPSLEALKSWLYNEGNDDEVAMARFSPVEVLATKNFGDMDEDEVRLINQLLRKITPRLAQLRSRLRVHSKKKRHLDLRQTIRKSLRQGGELNSLSYTERKRKKIKLVLLADVSKSMELYSRFFIHLMYAFHNSYDRIATWVFSTAIHEVSDILDGYDFDQAFQICRGAEKTLASLRRFWVVAARRNSSFSPFGPCNRSQPSPRMRLRWAKSISTLSRNFAETLYWIVLAISRAMSREPSCSSRVIFAAFDLGAASGVR